MIKKIIIYDSDHPGAARNFCFTEEYALQGPGHRFTFELARKAISKGFEIVTADVFLKSIYPENSVAYCISDMYTSKTKLVLKRGAIPFICLSTESPIIARDFYINIKKRAGQFIYNIQFRGTAERLASTLTKFSAMYYPTDKRTPLPLVPWKDKKFLILINRNKRMFYSGDSTLKGKTRSFFSQLKIRVQKMADPWIRSREFYKDRIEAIRYFSDNPGFFLYGTGWENKIPGFPKSYHQAAKKVYHGSLGSQEKYKVMNGFRFAICFENCEFPGYVTEKIFDCFISGCIPVYLGAPDIRDFVPADTFVDYRKFKDFRELESFLSSFTQEAGTKMLQAAKTFMSSKDFDKYFLENIVNSIIEKIESYRVSFK